MLNFFYDEKKEIELQNKIKDLSYDIKLDNRNADLYFNRAMQNYQLSQQYYDVMEAFLEGMGDKEKYLKYVNDAYADIESAISLGVKNDYAYTFRIFMLKKLKRWRDVVKYGLELYDSIGCTGSDCALIGEAFYHLKEWQKCIDFYSMTIEQLGEKDANNVGVKIYIERGISYSMLEDHESSVQDFLRHIKYNEIGRFDRFIYFFVAREYEDVENWDKAIEYFTLAIKEDPEDTEAYFRRGRLYCDVKNDYAKAAVDFDKVIDLSEEDVYINYHYCGYTYLHKGEIDEGQGNYELALKDYERSIETYEKAAELSDEDDCRDHTVDFAVSLKNDLLKKMSKQKSINNVPESNEKDANDDLDTFIMIVQELINDKKYDNAMSTCKEAIQELGDSPLLYKYMGYIYYKTNNYQNAIECFDHCENLSYTDKTLFFYRGFCYYLLLNAQKSLENCNKAIEIDENYADAYFLRATSYRRLNKKEEALRDIEMALKYRPDDKMYLDEKIEILDLE